MSFPATVSFLSPSPQHRPFGWLIRIARYTAISWVLIIAILWATMGIEGSIWYNLLWVVIGFVTVLPSFVFTLGIADFGLRFIASTKQDNQCTVFPNRNYIRFFTKKKALEFKREDVTVEKIDGVWRIGNASAIITVPDADLGHGHRVRLEAWANGEAGRLFSWL